MRQVRSSEKAQVCASLRLAPAKTYYENPINKILGKYTVAWEDGQERICVRSRLRLQDFEGHYFRPKGLKYLPNVLSTYLQSRKNFILKRPIPFLVYEAINFLDSVLSPNAKVLEFGGGNSSLWFLSKQCHLTSIEHSKPWIDEIKRHITINQNQFDQETLKQFNFLQMEGQETLDYVKAQSNELYDVILVDSTVASNNRYHCIKAAIQKLKTGGWMILDNSDHPNNWPAQEFMNAQFERVRYTGFAPMGLTISQTSFWQKK